MDPDNPDYYSDEEWYADQVAAAGGVDTASSGLQDLGSGNYYDPSDGSVYLGDTGEWVYPDQGFVDPVSGTEIQSDGTLIFQNGDQLNTDGTWILSDGSVLQTSADGITTYRDADGVLWESMDYAGAPNVWQNTQTGDVFNSQDGTLLTSQQVAAGDPTGTPTGTTRPPASSGSGASAPGGGAGGGLSGGGKPPSLEDLLKLLASMNGQQQQVAAAKSAGASTAQLAQLQAQLAAAARSAAPAVTGTASVTQFLKDNAPILIAGGLLAVLLLSRRPAPTYVYEKPAA